MNNIHPLNLYGIHQNTSYFILYSKPQYCTAKAKKGELPLPKIIDDVFKILFIEMIRFYRGI